MIIVCLHEQVRSTTVLRLMSGVSASYSTHSLVARCPLMVRISRCDAGSFVISCQYVPLVTVRHGSADTVVRAMNAFNGKCYFSGSDSSETF